MNEEFNNKKKLAIELGLLPTGICEIEFTVTEPSWRAERLEYWSSAERHDYEHVTVDIPETYREQFIFIEAKRYKEYDTLHKSYNRNDYIKN